MAKRTFHFDKLSLIKKDIRVEVDLSRFEKQYQNAQYWLDGQIMTDMVPLMPHNAGTFIQQTRAASAALQGSGQVYAAFGIQGRFLHEGKVMIDPVTKSPWAREGAKKIVTERDLEYSQLSNPQAGAHWYDRADKTHGKEWLKGVKRRAGGN